MGSSACGETKCDNSRRAQLRRSFLEKLKTQQTNATGQSNWQANHRDFSQSR